MKCSQCNREAEDAEFKQCRRCRERKHSWATKNHEKVRDSDRRYRQANHKKVLDSDHRYRVANRAKICEKDLRWRNTNPNYQREWVAANPEKQRVYQRKWSKANPDKRIVWGHNRRARIKGNGGVIPLDVGTILLEEQNGLCYLCGKPLYAKFDDPVSIEHKIPVSRGGSNDISNIGLAHISCNRRKHTKTPEEFLQSRNL